MDLVKGLIISRDRILPLGEISREITSSKAILVKSRLQLVVTLAEMEYRQQELCEFELESSNWFPEVRWWSGPH